MTTILAAVTMDNAIGYQGDLITSDPLDMFLFKTITTNNTVIMGRKTADSLPNGTHLPNRTNFIITSKASPRGEDYSTYSLFPDLVTALLNVPTYQETYIIGGASIYEQALNSDLVDRIILTRHHYVTTLADTYFPQLDLTQWKLTKTIPYYAAVNTQPIYTEIEFYEHIN